MNKKDFLSILANGLKDFPEKELADILFDYQEHFTIGKSNGKTEEEIINELGNPYEIVYQYRCAYLEKTSYDTQDTLNLDKDDTKFYCDVNYEDVYTDTNGYDSNSWCWTPFWHNRYIYRNYRWMFWFINIWYCNYVI